MKPFTVVSLLRAVFLTFLISIPTLVHANEIISQPDGSTGTDVWLSSAYYGGGQDNDHLRVGGWGDYYYGLIKFDISGLPPVASSAKIKLYAYPFPDTRFSPTSMYLDLVTSSWNEQTKWSARPSYSNLGTIPVPSLDAWYEIDVTDLYNAWQSGQYDNFGIQLRPTSNNAKMSSFYSSDYVYNPALRPKLVVEYEGYSCTVWQQ